ncbi:hypothetical protein lerEdw1_012852 [Lerista edwardsae]|nr:hypothetical protein lerEdw1_012852 [Lerista edwardsae]
MQSSTELKRAGLHKASSAYFTSNRPPLVFILSALSDHFSNWLLLN